MRAWNPLPSGTTAIGYGLLINGIATYGFLIIAKRALGDDAYGGLAVLWGLVYILGPGLFQPLEQEIARVTADRASRGLGSAPVLRTASRIGAVELFVVVGDALAVEQAALYESRNAPALDGFETRLGDLDGGVPIPEAEFSETAENRSLARTYVEDRGVGNAATKANDIVRLVDRAEATPLGLALVAVGTSGLRFSRQRNLLREARRVPGPSRWTARTTEMATQTRRHSPW